MGRMAAEGFAEAVGEGAIDLEQALRWHLTCNHYPPVGHMLEVALEAIEVANNDDWDFEIDLPGGTLYRGQPAAPASAIIEALHLEEFLS